MTFKFYVKMDGETYGPYSVRELMGLELLDDTLITEESIGGEWHQANEFDFEDLLRKEETLSDASHSSNLRHTYLSSAYFKWLLILVAILLVIVCIAYVFNDSPSDSRPIPVSPTQKPVISQPATSSSPNQEPTSQKVMCPMCSGHGVTEPMPGDIMSASLQQTCTGCNGTGVVTHEKSAELSKMMQEVKKMINSTPDPSPSQKQHNIACRDCMGNGKCKSCAGRGEKRYEGQYGQPDGIIDCPICYGTGRCKTCHGSGHIR